MPYLKTSGTFGCGGYFVIVHSEMDTGGEELLIGRCWIRVVVLDGDEEDFTEENHLLTAEFALIVGHWIGWSGAAGGGGGGWFGLGLFGLSWLHCVIVVHVHWLGGICCRGCSC